MMNRSSVLQIVPRAPGIHDGVGDYALTLARNMRDRFGRDTIFAAAVVAEAVCDKSAEMPKEFEAIPLAGSLTRNVEHVILHYVNYGYQKRGVPFELLSILRQLRRDCSGRLLTIFHELYASGPPWTSAFWLRPLQTRIARSIAQLSDTCIVSSETLLAYVKRLTPQVNARVRPVPSNFGEPALTSDQLTNRSPRRWAICGGTASVERSLRSLRAIMNRIPDFFSPQELFIIGGKENQAIRSLLLDLPNIRTEYRPDISPGDASQVLSSCSLAWLDYFHRTDVPTDVILKSSAFAAVCAHGVIPIFPNRGSIISLERDLLPGPFFVDRNSHQLPAVEDRAKISADFYNWYVRHASSAQLAHDVTSALGIAANA
ncbi:MAG: hypothetical protein ABI925_02625 [Verrucomicrobiota bacterium]